MNRTTPSGVRSFRAHLQKRPTPFADELHRYNEHLRDVRSWRQARAAIAAAPAGDSLIDFLRTL
jgi:hypothetical protein